MKNNPLARKSDLVIQKSGNETLVYNLKTNKAFCLNETSSMIWLLCDGHNSVVDIAQKTNSKLKDEIIEGIVLLALDQLSRDGLIEHHDAIESHFVGLSRREIIQKIGFASAIALPVVSSLVAPKAAFAASCLMPLFPAPPNPSEVPSPAIKPPGITCFNYCNNPIYTEPACCDGKSRFGGASSFTPPGGPTTCTCPPADLRCCGSGAFPC